MLPQDVSHKQHLKYKEWIREAFPERRRPHHSGALKNKQARECTHSRYKVRGAIKQTQTIPMWTLNGALQACCCVFSKQKHCKGRGIAGKRRMRLKPHMEHMDIVLSSPICPPVSNCCWFSILGTVTNAVVNTGVWVTFDKSFISFGDNTWE